MQEIDVKTCADYLRSQGLVAPEEKVDVRELDGGVSNVVLYVTRSGGDRFVLKQAREQLRVDEPWFCNVERIWREVEVLRICERLTSSDVAIDLEVKAETPQLLFEDRENYLFTMTAAPPEHVVWKSELLAGRTGDALAIACGNLLGRLHAGSWNDSGVAQTLDDRQFFNDLRIDPYYRHIGRAHSDLQPAVQRLIDSVWSHRYALVHGDFSPKNLLVYGDRLMLIDFEVGHYGDPAFDLGFFLSHLILKAFCASPDFEPLLGLSERFLETYRSQMNLVLDLQEWEDLESRTLQNFAGCALARLDGKSKIDYLVEEERRAQVRQLCRTLFSESPTQWKDLLGIIRTTL